jgi:hypothetical protein
MELYKYHLYNSILILIPTDYLLLTTDYKL